MVWNLMPWIGRLIVFWIHCPVMRCLQNFPLFMYLFFISLFEDYGAAVRIVYRETGWEENLRRNADRTDSVPESAVEDMLGKLIPPH